MTPFAVFLFSQNSFHFNILLCFREEAYENFKSKNTCSPYDTSCAFRNVNLAITIKTFKF